MTKRHKQQRRSQALSNYTLLVQPVAYRELKQLPGHIRQRPPYQYEDLEELLSGLADE